MSETQTDWAAWSRDAVRGMQALNDAWVGEFGLSGAKYKWDLESATLVLNRPRDAVHASLCVVGSVSASEGTFLWSWANDAIPSAAKAGIEAVRLFGQRNGLSLLTEASWRGGRAEGLEMLAVASRVLSAEGSWVAPGNDTTLFLALKAFRIVAGERRAWWRRAGPA